MVSIEDDEMFTEQISPQFRDYKQRLAVLWKKYKAAGFNMLPGNIIRDSALRTASEWEEFDETVKPAWYHRIRLDMFPLEKDIAVFRFVKSLRNATYDVELEVELRDGSTVKGFVWHNNIDDAIYVYVIC